jgi:hypothetical protein
MTPEILLSLLLQLAIHGISRSELPIPMPENLCKQQEGWLYFVCFQVKPGSA